MLIKTTSIRALILADFSIKNFATNACGKSVVKVCRKCKKKKLEEVRILKNLLAVKWQDKGEDL